MIWPPKMMLQADEVQQRGSMDSYASSQEPASNVQRTDARFSDKNQRPVYSRDVMESPTSLSHDLSEVVQTASTYSSSSLTENSGSTTSDGHAVRVRTKGHDLKSGFPYHPGLYDLRVRPDGKVDGNGFPSYQTKLTSLDWQQFSDQLIDSTKFDTADYAKLWAAVGSLALTGSILTSVWVSR
jgi:hypothetical protein